MAIQCRRRKEKSGPSVSAQNRRHNPLRLSYASINWIRFKGSSCRASRRMTSQSPAGTPLVAGKLTPMIRAVKMLMCGGVPPAVYLSTSRRISAAGERQWS
jgi:hypothetical protein